MTRLKLAVVALFAFSGEVALAHSFFTGTTDPVLGGACCGGHDCSRLPSGTLHWEAGGVRIILTAEQAHAINPDTQLPVNAFVTGERIMQSPDYNWYACIHNSDRQAPCSGVLCLWGPPSS